MRHRGWPLLAALSALLVLAVTAGTLAARRRAETDAQAPDAQPPEEALLDAVMDRIGVTRWSQALEWYEMEESGLLADAATDDTPVWVAHGDGQGRFHSVPLCGGMKAPEQLTLAEAIEAGREPCGVCWAQAETTEEAGPPIPAGLDALLVWTSRDSMAFHSAAECGGSPQRIGMTWGDAEAAGRLPCAICWEGDVADAVQPDQEVTSP